MPLEFVVGTQEVRSGGSENTFKIRFNVASTKYRCLDPDNGPTLLKSCPTGHDFIYSWSPGMTLTWRRMGLRS